MQLTENKNNKSKLFVEDEFSPRKRNENIEKLKSEEFDILIIGGGITGASTAYEASKRGYKVALVEMKDFASGTSSKSSKLLHGGLRYLEQFKFKLVFEALRDRNELFKRMPHIAKPLSFLMPVYKDYKESLQVLNIGVTLYDFLSLFSRKMSVKFHKYLNKNKVIEVAPDFEKIGLQGGLEYIDGYCDDARLTLENIKSADRSGSVIVNYVKIMGFEKNELNKVKSIKAKNLVNDEKFKIKAKVILNATGPWVDSINQKSDKDYKNKLKPTKGIHLIVPKLVDDKALLIKTAVLPIRWMFVIPYGKYSIIGTTDTEKKVSRNDFSYLEKDNYADENEIKYLLESVNYYFPKAKLSKNDIVSSYGGWRPLIAPEGEDISESDISREHEIFETDSGIVAIAGGKLTTFVSMAKEIVDFLANKNELKSLKSIKPDGFKDFCSWDSNLDYQSFLDSEIKNSGLDKNTTKYLIEKYGLDYLKIKEIITYSQQLSQKVSQLADSSLCIKAEIVYSVLYEMTVTLNDFMERRNRILLRDENQGINAYQEIGQIMSFVLKDNLDWSESFRSEWVEKQYKEYESEINKVNNYKN